jgi:hypothetical protein
MKKILLPCIMFFIMKATVSQNVTIGPNNDQVALQVNGNIRLKHTAGANAGIYFEGLTPNVTRGYMGMIDDNHVGIKSTGSEWGLAVNTSNGNVGIGTASPQYKLDVNGRMRLLTKSQNNTITRPGIILENTDGTDLSFVGLRDDSCVGIRKFSSDTDWGFLMNLKTGFTGINTNLPTAQLDVNGNARFRVSYPVKGSLLTSSDANGNAEWENVIAFRANGLANNVDVDVPVNTWTKILFDETPAFNYGLFYQTVQSQFYAAEQGLYDFNFQITYKAEQLIEQSRARVMLLRNGVQTELLRFERNFSIDNAGERSYEPSMINYQTGDMLLLAGDYIWIEAFINNVVSPTSAGYASSAKLLASQKHTWFSGRLKARK